MALEKRRWWATLGNWEGESGDEELDKEIVAFGHRILAEIPGAEYSEGGIVLKTWDENEAKAAVEKVSAMVKETYPGLEDGIHYDAQPQCPKCKMLGHFWAHFCARCGTELE